MNVAIHWMDKDSSSAKAIKQHYPDTKLMLCGGALVDAGTEPENFVTRMKILPHHAKDEHEWEDGKCDFHSLTLCLCGHCGKGDVKCKGKAYKT